MQQELAQHMSCPVLHLKSDNHSTTGGGGLCYRSVVAAVNMSHNFEPIKLEWGEDNHRGTVPMILSSLKKVIKVLYLLLLDPSQEDGKAKLWKAVLHFGINDNNSHVVAGDK